MELFLTVLAMLVLIGVSDIVHRFLPFIPVPLIQIVMGALGSLLPGGIHIELEPEVFFLLFIAPLLFYDGKRTPREDLWNLRAPILLLALGLVFVTVLVAGYTIHWLIPALSLPASFALAAILSPTDAVAVSSMAKKTPLPKRILRLLEGEALMNDASGLVAFKFAIAAAITGQFSLPRAAGSFLLIAAGGLLIGAIVGYLLIQIGVFIRKLGMEDVTTHMLLQLLTPFIIFLIAEHWGLSGILAVVAGGVIHAIERDRTASPDFKLKVVSTSTWSVVIFVLNGLVFVILGALIPEVMHKIFESEAFDNKVVLGYVAIITVVLITIRFLWLYLISRRQSPVKDLFVTAISGVRGAVTLVGALSIPLVMSSGEPFPQRDLMIFLAAGVILFSLIIASILLPILMRGSEKETAESRETTLKEAMIHAALKRLRMMNGPDADKSEVIGSFLNCVKEVNKQKQWADNGLRKQEAEIRMLGMRAEREELERLMENGEISEELAAKLTGLLDRMESLLAGRLAAPLQQSWTEVRRLLSRLFSESGMTAEGKSRSEVLTMMDARLRMAEAAIQAITPRINDRNERAAQVVIAHYELLIARLRQAKPGSPMLEEDDRRIDQQMEAVEEQRNYVEGLVSRGEINRKLAVQLRRFVNELETAILED
ncbi:CPA1 family monovalent cation:H+ antiporter [Paenibacillus phyllosphaerae]|uniref:CPA1 family monovalent cation:H+ antiporter n=1 Tax=Paenibacillus phyllosphaerae TaxID=274593 RepID=A0A7W5B0Y0_9BACL|nr:Na+/H+ antiporter [Paenibacillus phyllosphaerae]MBB3111886.1 CPA1 family monovalent cation:H+ antiporter [Paenibacillus phyllosphaerae]